MIMMRKSYLVLSLLAIAGLWVGCSNDDEVVDTSRNGQEISFRVQGGAPALRTTGTTATYVDAFVVYGTDDVAGATTIFDGVTVARQVGGGFDYNPKKYYSEGAASANFVAYSPASANISSPVTTALATSASFAYTVKTPDNSGDTTQEDLLIAGTGVATPSATAVNLAFQHALSRIFVKATNGLSETVVIKGLTLKNLYPSGTLTGTAAAAWTWAWTPSGTETDYSYVLAPTGVAVPAGLSTATLVTSMEQGMMVIPQATVNDTPNDVTAGDFALEVTYDVGNLVDQVTYVYLTDGYAFALGTQYAITINFTTTVTNLIEINFDITVAPFTNDATMP